MLSCDFPLSESASFAGAYEYIRYSRGAVRQSPRTLPADSRRGLLRSAPGCAHVRGGLPVVAHPPCRAWSAKCAHQAKPPAGEKELGPLCVEWLNKCGGVLEHPAYSRLFDFCGIPKPGEPERRGLWSMSVDQSWFGSPITKRTWLVFSGIPRSAVELPFCLHDGSQDHRKWQMMSKARRSLTPLNMAVWLVETARQCSIQFSPVQSS